MIPTDWDIRRKGRVWTGEEFDRRCRQAPEKIEYTGGIFFNERQRLIVLGIIKLYDRVYQCKGGGNGGRGRGLSRRRFF